MRAMPSRRYGSDRPWQAPDLRLIIDSVPALILTSQPDGYIDFFNQTWQRFVGLPLEDLLGSKWMSVIHPDDLAPMSEKWSEVLVTGERFECEARVRRADGEYRWMIHHKVPLRDKRGGIVKWFGSSIDIEDRRRAEDSLTLNEAFLSEAQQLARVGGWALKLPDTINYWSPVSYEIFGLDPAQSPPRNIAEVLLYVHPEDRERFLRTIKEFLAGGETFDCKYRIVRPDGQVRVVHSLAAPTRAKGVVTRIVGARIDITEQERMTQELERSKAYLAEAQKVSHTGSFGWKVSSGELIWSEETYRILGYERGTRPTLELAFQRTHPEDLAFVKQELDAAAKADTDLDFEHRLLMPDGSVKHVHVLALARRDESGGVEFAGALKDVTDAKQASVRLQQSEKELRTIIETIPAFIGTASPDGTVDFVSQSWLDYTGLSREQWLGRGWLTVTHPEDVDRAAAKWKECLANQKPCVQELRCRLADGTYHWFRGDNVPLLDERGDVVKWYGTLVDIEDRKRNEEILRQSEAELRQILDTAPQHLCVLGPDGRRLYLNEAALDYHGWTLEWWQTCDMRSLFHPDDWERVARESQKAFATGTALELEARVPRRDGEHRWFLFRCKPLRDAEGRITRWALAAIDIEDRKQAEERLQNENVALREEIDKASMFEEIVGTSPALRKVLSGVAKVAPTDSTVLLTGETGTGKELIARAIHRLSPRSARAFVGVNFAAIPRDLIASELFGHEKGAFTGATQRRLGRFELAKDGTIFLDEIGELPAEIQITLLRVLQEREFERVGGNMTIRSEVRVIAATNRDLEAAIKAGTFRSDLYYRLNVFPIEIPPLRDRREDIPLLVEYFVDRYTRKSGKRIRRINKKSLDLLRSYSWPGNIRELQNVIERSVIVCESENLSVDESWLSRQPLASELEGEVELSKELAAREKAAIEAALSDCGGRVSGPSGAAKKLGMPRSTLESKIRSLKINKNHFRAAVPRNPT